MQHAHVRKLIDHHPVVAPALRLRTVTALDAQVDGVQVPEEQRQYSRQTAQELVGSTISSDDVLCCG